MYCGKHEQCLEDLAAGKRCRLYWFVWISSYMLMLCVDDGVEQIATQYCVLQKGATYIHVRITMRNDVWPIE